MQRRGGLQSCFLLCLAPVWAFSQQAPVPAVQSPAPPEPRDPALAVRPPANQPRPASPVTREGRIKIDVVVTDKSGKSLAGLQLADFTLLDDNLPEKILSFNPVDKRAAASDPPAGVILVMDDLNVGARDFPYAKQQVAKFLRQDGGHPALPISILLLTDTKLMALAGPSTDGNGLASLLDQQKGELRTGGVGLGGNGAVERYQLSLRALDSIVNHQGRMPGRKLLIWIGSGWPMLDGVGFSLSAADAEKQNFGAIVSLSSRIREAHIALYTASWDLSNLNFDRYKGYLKGVKSSRQANFPNLALQVLSVQSGGRVLSGNSDLTAEINSCIADASPYYRISFDPPRADHADEYHDLKVQIDKPGLDVRSSSGYYNQP